jgi:hypothetical protein
VCEAIDVANPRMMIFLHCNDGSKTLIYIKLNYISSPFASFNLPTFYFGVRELVSSSMALSSK